MNKTFLLLLLIPSLVIAQSRTVVTGEPLNSGPVLSGIPFGFFSESFGLGLGVGWGLSHWPAPESSLLGAATVGTSGSYNLALGGSQWRVTGFERLYVSPMAVFARYIDQFLYVGSNNPGFEGQRAGASASDPDNVLAATQWDNWAKVEFKYLLPIADGRGKPVVNLYQVRDGVLEGGATGGHSANPLTSGRSYVEFTPAWRNQTLENEGLEVPLETVNITLALERDNRDYPDNPSRGSLQRLSFQKDFTDQDGLGGWEVWEVQFEKLFDFGASAQSQQRVLAFNFWSAYVPTWETDGDGNVTNRPPQYEGATLGGLDRMRGFEGSRYHDKSAVYYGVEYRVIPRWQPVPEIEMLKWAKIRYWQFAVFGEIGEVADSWDIDDLHSGMKADVGFSLRGMLYQAVCRLDIAFSEEGSRVVAMYGHPF
jgi:hypothetical protein